MKLRLLEPARRKLVTYWAVIALYALVFGWWMFFFWHQSAYLLRRMERGGVALDATQVIALKNASDESMRMFLFEGAFLGLMLATSVTLVLRSLHREIAVHRQQRNFLSAVTHELKSPLASARLYVESLLLGRVPNEKRERYLQHALQDLDRLRGITEDLLESARMAKAAPEISLERLDLAELARGRVPLLAQAESARVRARVLAPDPVWVEADARALETILRNLIGNAVKYGGDDQTLEVEVRGQGSRAILSVRDHGPGLAGADPVRIFDAFVRGGDENVRTRPGVGLGLFMVRELVQAQGGSVRAHNAFEGGLVVELELPASARTRRAENGVPA